MRKFYYYLLLTFIITGCDNKEELSSKSQSGKNPTQTYIINGDILYEAEITDGSKPKKPIFIYDIPEKRIDNKKTTNKLSDGTMVFDFSYGIANKTNSGCTVDIYSNSSGTYYTNYGVYGYNPYPYNPVTNQYLIRGYGKPYHNYYYNSLILQTSNKNNKGLTPRNNIIINDNLAKSSAMSIEYKFKPNITYEISLKTFFNDNRKLVENKQSEGFPTVNVHLSDSPLLSTIEKTCENDIIRIASLVNYTKSYTLEDNIIKDRIITYKFSPTEEKNALIISLVPKLGEDRSIEVPKSNYTMVLSTVTIKELPFDPSINSSGGRR
ncbi:hypothetical protein [Flavobacterium soyae]|uniref:DUF4595 domain-containing protein n=1 Tax=Flavobacterium soyae TaxID=2903098 RepID=A0ABZ2U9F1_9FLAO